MKHYTKADLERMWKSLEVVEDGFIQDEDLEDFWFTLHESCLFLEVSCPESVDSAETFLCADGQEIEICNPRQTHFAAFIR